MYNGYFLQDIGIVTIDNLIHWCASKEVVKKAKNPFFAAVYEHETLVETTFGLACIQHDTLILLDPYNSELVVFDSIEWSNREKHGPPWTHTKYFLDFRESTPSKLQECVTGRFVNPEEDGVQEIIDNLKPAVKSIITSRNTGQVIMEPEIPEP